jgi:glyoxylase-like metal-dependent hydrolase (beta-lactamase superfamily II)
MHETAGTPAAGGVAEVEPGVFRIDLELGGTPGIVAAYLLVGAGPTALVETGPASTIETLLSGIEAAGVDPGAIEEIVVTHVHLDHAGGAGDLLARLPRPRLHVHPSGAPHLADPGRLLASARRIYGDALDGLWGGMRAVPPARLRVLPDGADLPVAGTRLRTLHTPGHAGHHCAFHEPERGVVFTGDVGGIRLGGIPHVVPPTPPPDIDLAAWGASLLRLRQLRPRSLALTHFGGYRDVDWHLDEVLSRLHRWAGWVEGCAAGAAPRESIAAGLAARDAERIRSAGHPELVELYERAIPYAMCVDGLIRSVAPAAR